MAEIFMKTQLILHMESSYFLVISRNYLCLDKTVLDVHQLSVEK